MMRWKVGGGSALSRLKLHGDAQDRWGEGRIKGFEGFFTKGYYFFVFSLDAG